MQNELMKSLKVLFVEDEEIIRQKSVSTLELIVGDVKEASDGVEALEVMKSFTPDLIITDIEMPRMNGIEFIKKLRETDKNICIMVQTAYTSEKYLLELIDMHIEKYIIKPINFEKLLDGLKIACEYLKTHKNLVSTLPKEYKYDKTKKILLHDNVQINLTKTEIAFVELLIKNANSITTYEELQNVIWQDSVMTDNALRSMVRNLRKKLPDDFIQNLSGVGYKLA